MKLYLGKIPLYFHYIIYYRNTTQRYYYFLIKSVFCILLSLTCIDSVMLLCHSCPPLLANFQLGNPFYQQIRGIPHTHLAILLLFLLISGLQLQFLLSISARHSVYISQY